MIKMIFNATIGNDAIVREANGNKFVTFDVANSERYKDKNGVKQENTMWIECIYNNTSIAPYLKRGTQLLIEGKPQAKAFTAKDGSVKSSLCCKVITINFLASPKKDNIMIAGKTEEEINKEFEELEKKLKERDKNIMDNDMPF